MGALPLHHDTHSLLARGVAALGLAVPRRVSNASLGNWRSDYGLSADLCIPCEMCTGEPLRGQVAPLSSILGLVGLLNSIGHRPHSLHLPYIQRLQS